jgi:transglutaminase-like putative cysteine protease
LAGSAALLAVAAAQSVDLSLAAYVIAWAACGLFGLVAMWQSIAEVRCIPWRAVAVSATAVLLLGVALVAVLPAPRVSASLIFPSSSDGSQVDSSSNLTDGSASLPAHAANPDGRTGVGGFLGFAKSLDTGARNALGNEVVMRVRANRPNFWVGETFDEWNGQSWLQAGDPSNGPGVNQLPPGSPFTIPPTADEAGAQANDPLDIQTYFLAESGPNLVFHADQAQRVYIQSRSLLLPGDGTIVSSTSMGAGTVYTVVSEDTEATGTQLRQATLPKAVPTTGLAPVLSRSERSHDLQLPHSYGQVAALARQITASVTTSATSGPRTYDVVESIESWMSSHVRYTTDIPPLAPGADAVDSFLFGSREGFCEQISTATVVMLRTLGIPAREAVGYVPGSYNPITDLYDVEAKDAHAWVQVWFPGYGWQNFDPTAVVPLANPAPGSVIAHDVARSLGGLPWIPIGALVLVAVVGWTILRRRGRRPPTWAHQVASDLAQGGAKRGRPRRAGETLTAYGERLAQDDPATHDELLAVTVLVERSTYGGIEPTAVERAEAIGFARRYRTSARNRPVANALAQERESASASSKDAPAASNGR